MAHAEIDRRLHAATSLTREEWRELDHNDPRWKELLAVNNKIYRIGCTGGKSLAL